MKRIPVKEAVGSVLCHDITQIIPGKVKGRAFKKGHIIRAEDIPVLLSLGKDNIYVWENKKGQVHENDAAVRLKNLAGGEGLTFSEIKEGKIDFIAEYDGLLKVNKELLYKVNSIGEIALATLHNNYPVKKGKKVAGTRVIPLVIDEEKISRAEALVGEEKIVKVISYSSKKIGIVTTGNEVYYERIKDAFGPVIRKKAEEYGCHILGQTILLDDCDSIVMAIEAWLRLGADMIICTGGMSVDPDDVTPSAIIKSGARIMTYGSPVLPGSMFLLSYIDSIPVLGLPGCVMYSRRTVFDLVFPRILAGEVLTGEDIAAYGHGGLCMDCQDCRYPDCSFGKGV